MAIAVAGTCKHPTAEPHFLNPCDPLAAQASLSRPSKTKTFPLLSSCKQLHCSVNGHSFSARFEEKKRRKAAAVTAMAEALAVPEGRAAPVSTPEVEALLDSLKWDSNGLVVAIAQHAGTGAILMQGFADRDAVSATLASHRATFYSRSRKCLWTKGETSSNFISVVDVYLDCDRDSVIYMGLPDGPTCHTGAQTCYFERVDVGATPASHSSEAHASEALTTFYALEATIGQRRAEAAAEAAGEVPAGKPSWTRRLLDNPALLCSKVREEAGELCQTLEAGEGRERAVSEMADLLYHSLVLLALQDGKLEDVAAVLRRRFEKSGVEEKASRKAKNED